MRGFAAALLALLLSGVCKGGLVWKGNEVDLGDQADWMACRTNGDGCMKAKVPGTVLSNMLENGTFNGISDPYFENNLSLLKDIDSPGGKDFYTFNYSTTFSIDEDSAPSRYWLHLNGITYRATVRVDGIEVHTTEGGRAETMFHRFRYSLGYLQKGKVYTLNILVLPPDHVGNVTIPGQGGDHQIARNAAMMQCTAGWDWIQPTPDRNTGIWDTVVLKRTSDIALFHPFMEVTEVDPVHKRANVHARVFVSKSEGSVNGTVQIGSSIVAMNISQSAGEFEVEFPEISLDDVKLWWPHTDGEQHMYSATITVGEETTSVRFGIRNIQNYYDNKTGGRIFTINGKDVFLQGGNWIATDQLLRYSASRERYYTEIMFHKQMGFNLIRVWGGGIVERELFYEVADELGVFVHTEFWMTGDNNGRWAGSYSWPDNHIAFESAVRDTVLMTRNHPSLLMYVGGNELYPAALSPSPDIKTFEEGVIRKLHPKAFYIPSTMSNYTDFDPNYALAPKDGPYGMLALDEFSTKNPGLNSSLMIGFQPEIGSASHPVYASMKRFLGPNTVKQFPGKNNTNIPPMYQYHKHLGWVDNKGRDTVYAYGDVKTSQEFAFQAQLAQFTQTKMTFESFQQNIWTWYTAVIYWKSQSPWPVFRGALYDTFLAQTGGYFGVQAAFGKQITVQMDLQSFKVYVVNKGSEINARMVLKVRAYNEKGIRLFSRKKKLNKLVANSAQPVEQLKSPFKHHQSRHKVLFYRLSLHYVAHDDPLSENTYWLSDDVSKPQNYSVLKESRVKRRHIRTKCTTTGNGTAVVTIRKSLPTQIAFGVRLTLERKDSVGGADPRVLPTFYSSPQYFSLIGSEKRSHELTFSPEEQGKLQVRVEALNLSPIVVEC